MITLLVLAGLIGWALERNHRRQRWPSTRGIGHNAVPDRDLERAVADVRAADQFMNSW
ncbi:hypothetical protein EV652_12577 [Kribbella steppae]|uniref:Uncharacterized protein n=1 Tax=Kribbella steppae TaxID=2512223 RepID=A0A4R2GUE8_9ACTN|nr:hypothetical protein [Kribbella steppae]TCO13916.1 hypothetical protein EV652_12577 [Kribbella steppae]